MTDPLIVQALAALAENDRDKGPSADIEARLLRRFRAQKAKRRMRWAVRCVLAAAAAILLTVTSLKQTPVRKPAAEVAALSAPEAPVKTASPVVPSVVRKVRRAPTPPAPVSQEVTTDFFSLLDPAPPFDRGQILRVQLPAAAMQAVGLPVDDEHLGDPIQADVLVGEEGLVRAIRFVTFQFK